MLLIVLGVRERWNFHLLGNARNYSETIRYDSHSFYGVSACLYMSHN